MKKRGERERELREKLIMSISSEITKNNSYTTTILGWPSQINMTIRETKHDKRNNTEKKDDLIFYKPTLILNCTNFKKHEGKLYWCIIKLLLF